MDFLLEKKWVETNLTDAFMSEALVFKIDLNCSRLRLFLFISGEFPHVTLDHNVFFHLP